MNNIKNNHSVDFLQKNFFYQMHVATSNQEIAKLLHKSNSSEFVEIKENNIKQIAFKGYYTAKWNEKHFDYIYNYNKSIDPISAYIDNYWQHVLDTKIIKVFTGITEDSITKHNSDILLDATLDNNEICHVNEIYKQLSLACETVHSLKSGSCIICMHPYIYEMLDKHKLIDHCYNSRGVCISNTFKGNTIYFTDVMPSYNITKDNTMYYTFVCGTDMLYLNIEDIEKPQYISQSSKNELDVHNNTLYSARCFLIHPCGYTINRSLLTHAEPLLYNEQLASGCTWERVYLEREQIPFVAVKVTI